MRLENFLFKKIELWILIIVILLFLIVSITFAWLAKYSIELEKYSPKVATTVNKIMEPVDIFFKTSYKILTTGSANPSFLKVEFEPGFVIKDNYENDGYFLISAFDNKFKENSIFLYSLLDQELIKKWSPNVKLLNNLMSNNYKKTPEDLPMNFRSQHPLLLSDGGIIVNSGDGILVKLNKESEIEWFIERKFHHSIENGLDSRTVLTNIVMDEPLRLKTGHKFSEFRNDGYAIVSLDGNILEERSIAQILYDNEYYGLLFGQKWEYDKIHLNDAEFITKTDAFVKRGDIMISARNISTVFLYRPSSNKIIWLRSGPFLNQHDINYLDNGIFSIFGNDNVRGKKINSRLVQKYSGIYFYDMSKDKIIKKILLNKSKTSIDAQGRSRVLNDGKIFIDDGVQAMILSESGDVLLSYSHKQGNKIVGAMHWSRYYKKNEISDQNLNFGNK